MVNLILYSIFCLGIIAGVIVFICQKFVPIGYKIAVGVISAIKLFMLIYYIYNFTKGLESVTRAFTFIEGIMFIITAECVIRSLLEEYYQNQKRKNG